MMNSYKKVVVNPSAILKGGDARRSTHASIQRISRDSSDSSNPITATPAPSYFHTRRDFTEGKRLIAGPRFILFSGEF